MVKRILPLLVAILIYVLVGCKAGPLPTPAVTPTPRSGFGALTPVVPRDAIAHLTVGELYQRLQAGEAIQIVDARALSQYQIEHIAGAVSIPMEEVPARIQELARDRLVVFYCA